MKILYVLLFVFGSLLSSGSSRIAVRGSSTPWPWIPLSEAEIIQNHKDFASGLMKNRDLTQINTISYSPFGVGHALAVMNEKVVLNVSTVRLDSVLKTPAHKIARSYQTLLGLLNADPEISIVSRIYTPKRKNVLLTVGLGKLNTEVSLIDIDKNSEEVVQFVNSEVSRHVKNDSVIGNKFFPVGKPEQVLGFLANTLQYSSKWSVSWSPGPDRSFQSFYSSIGLPYMGTSANLPVYEDDNFQIIKVPMSGRRKQLLLARSKLHVKELSNSVSNVWDEFISVVTTLKSSDFKEKSVDVKIPRLQSVSGTSYYNELRDLGLNETMCSKSTRSFRGIRVGHLSQLSRVQFSLPYFQFTSITGLKGTQRYFPSTDHRERRLHVRVQTRAERNAAISVDHSSPNIDSKKSGNENEIIFDQPFFWSFQDEALGPVALGAVLHPNDGMENIANNFMETFLDCNL